MTERLALGFGFIVPTETVLHAFIPRPGTPHFSVVGYRSQTVTLQGALAIRIHETLTIGGGFIALSTLEGAIEVAPNAEGRIGSSARDQLVAEYAPVLGLSWEATEIGLSALCTGANPSARFGLPLDADLGADFPLPIPVLMVNGTAQYDPPQGEFELSYGQKDWRIGLGLAWHQWSHTPNRSPTRHVPIRFPHYPLRILKTAGWLASVSSLSGRVSIFMGPYEAAIGFGRPPFLRFRPSMLSWTMTAMCSPSVTRSNGK